jgi:hypothetical protein
MERTIIVFARCASGGTSVTHDTKRPDKIIVHLSPEESGPVGDIVRRFGISELQARKLIMAYGDDRRRIDIAAGRLSALQR